MPQIAMDPRRDRCLVCLLFCSLDRVWCPHLNRVHNASQSVSQSVSQTDSELAGLSVGCRCKLHSAHQFRDRTPRGGPGDS
uniref:Putative secreted protein n=1 Tax=Anopheles marajoara TaxID=58244 RepID=A0A2M4CBT1_9DIPT